MRLSIDAVPYGPKHAVMEDGHAAELAPKGLLPGRPADQSCPAQLSSIFSRMLESA